MGLKFRLFHFSSHHKSIFISFYMKSPKNNSDGEKLLIIKKKNLIIWHYFLNLCSQMLWKLCSHNFSYLFFLFIFFWIFKYSKKNIILLKTWLWFSFVWIYSWNMKIGGGLYTLYTVQDILTEDQNLNWKNKIKKNLIIHSFIMKTDLTSTKVCFAFLLDNNWWIPFFFL